MKYFQGILIVALLLALTGCEEATDVVSLETEKPVATAKVPEKAPEKTPGKAQEKAPEKTPEKTPEKKENVYDAGKFTLELPEEWEDHCTIEKDEYDGMEWVAFYQKECHRQIEGIGWLFSIAGYPDDSYKEQPSYEVIDTAGDLTYVAVFPTDVQFEGASKSAVKQYQKMSGQIMEVLKTFQKKS